jgi:hypothetical protein
VFAAAFGVLLQYLNDLLDIVLCEQTPPGDLQGGAWH